MSVASVEDDDNWLYGDSTASTEESNQQETKPQETDTTNISAENGDAEKPPGEDSADGSNKEDSSKEASTAEKSSNDVTPAAKGSDSEEDDDDDDDDDEVHVTIGDIKSTPPQFPPSYGGPTGVAPVPPPPVNLNLKRSTTSSSYSTGDRTKSLRSAGSLDPDIVGSINGISLYEFNLDTLEEKPWRKPGADITDYFNYGFTEETWKSYCEKQKKLRTENNAHVKVVANSGKDNLIAIPTVNENSKYASHLGLKKAGPPPGRKMSGNIDVIGAASLPSRRPNSRNENVIQVMGNRKYELPLGLPPLHLPPPHFPPQFMAPPPDVTMPPPSLAPPPIVPPTVIGTPSSYASTELYATADQYGLTSEEVQASYYNSSSWQPSNRESSDKHRYSYDNDDYERSKRHRDHERSKDRDRYDREDRYREERDRRHSRSDHRSDKEERRSSRRRHHHDDDDHSRSSRHKHKRSKRDRDEPSESKSTKEPTETTQDDTTLEEGEEKD